MWTKIIGIKVKKLKVSNLNNLSILIKNSNYANFGNSFLASDISPKVEDRQKVINSIAWKNGKLIKIYYLFIKGLSTFLYFYKMLINLIKPFSPR